MHQCKRTVVRVSTKEFLRAQGRHGADLLERIGRGLLHSYRYQRPELGSCDVWSADNGGNTAKDRLCSLVHRRRRVYDRQRDCEYHPRVPRDIGYDYFHEVPLVFCSITRTLFGASARGSSGGVDWTLLCTAKWQRCRAG